MSLHQGPSEFVTVGNNGKRFERNGAPYRFVGTTLWYGAHLAMEGAAGDRMRLSRELDQLQKLGVRNVRVLASSEGDASIPYHVLPAMTPSAGVYDRLVLEGLDYLLGELAQRDMLAIMVLTNGLPWSGGLAQYVAWATDTRSPFSMRNTDWDAYYSYVAHFFKLEEAMVLFDDFVRMLVGRVNSVTGVTYANDQTIMAWEIANEPRGGKGVVPEYQPWLTRVARLIKSLDANHLVALGSDGTGGGQPFRLEHEVDGIDYTSIHLWPEKWSWHKNSGEPTHEGLQNVIDRMQSYVSSHLQWSEGMHKPMVIEAFGMSRDSEWDVQGATAQRDAFFRAVFAKAQEYVDGGRPLGGVSFWGWAGEGRAATREDGLGWRQGDPFVGDAPSEPQGARVPFRTASCLLEHSFSTACRTPCRQILHLQHRHEYVRGYQRVCPRAEYGMSSSVPDAGGAARSADVVVEHSRCISLRVSNTVRSKRLDSLETERDPLPLQCRRARGIVLYIGTQRQAAR